MSQQQLMVPSLFDPPSAKPPSQSALATASFRRGTRNFLMSVCWIGYPLSATLPWVTGQVDGVVAVAIRLLIMFAGFFITQTIYNVLLRQRRAEIASQKAPKTLVERFEQVFRTLEQAGLTTAAQDARSIVWTTRSFEGLQTGVSAKVDEALQFHLSFLLRVASEILEDRAHHKRPAGKSPIQIGDGSNGFSGIQVGRHIFVGENDEFEGIRIGSLEIGEHKKRPSRSQPPAKVESGVPQVNNLPSCVAHLQDAIARSLAELSWLAQECRRLVSSSTVEAMEKEARRLRADFDQERKIAEELKNLDSGLKL